MNKYELMAKLGGRFATFTFVKKDGTLRKLNGRVGVLSYQNGGKNTHDGYPTHLTVWECRSRSYRTVDIDRLVKVSHNGRIDYL